MIFPEVAIVVINHNYRDFVAQAVESCLGQTYPRCFVLIVDDGSTDGSLDALDQYSGRVQVIAQPRGGQASAINTAVSVIHPDIFMFLDADDLLDHDVVERVVDAFEHIPVTGRVQFQLEYCDQAGTRLGRFSPARFRPIAEADRVRSVLMHNDDLTWSPMSGNAFRAATLATVLPIPEDSFPEIGADMYLVNTTALVAPVFNLDSSGGRYRLHDSNWHARTCHTAELSSRTLALSRATHKHLETFARRLDLPLPKSPVGSGSLTLRAHRMIISMASEGSAVTRRLTLLRLAAGGIRTAYQRRDRPLTIRLKYATWYIAMTLVPRKAAQRIVEQLFPPLITDGPNAR